VFAVYALLANTVLEVRFPVQTVLSENILLVQARQFAVIALLESTLEIREAFALIVPRVSILTLQGLKLATAVHRDQFRVAWEIPRVPFALQAFLQLVAVIRHVPHVLLARRTPCLALAAVAHVQPVSTLETT
jgi:hypothetical protein